MILLKSFHCTNLWLLFIVLDISVLTENKPYNQQKGKKNEFLKWYKYIWTEQCQFLGGGLKNSLSFQTHSIFCRKSIKFKNTIRNRHTGARQPKIFYQRIYILNVSIHLSIIRRVYNILYAKTELNALRN